MRLGALNSNITNVLSSAKSKSRVNSPDFKDIFADIIAETRNLREVDSANNHLLATGQIESIDKAMIDMEKADIALQLTLQIRNKVLDAYQEIMRMQI